MPASASSIAPEFASRGSRLASAPPSRIQTQLGQEKGPVTGRDLKLRQIALVGGFLREEDV